MTDDIPHNGTHEKACRDCGGPIPRGRWAFCSQRCRKRADRKTPYAQARRRADRKARRAQAAGAQVVVLFDPHEVFARDGWRCRSCGVPTPAALCGQQVDNAPSLDHEVALCDGGHHAPYNARLLCCRCNGVKGRAESSRASTGWWEARRGV